MTLNRALYYSLVVLLVAVFFIALTAVPESELMAAGVR